tara:strand:- start:62 stop:442 length:381 start_codon:yes stop_codon:yes gene_type:complete
MKTREIRHLGYNKIADAADFNRSTDFEHLCSMFRWDLSPEGTIFWDLVDSRNFTEALKICPQYREDVKISSDNTKVNDELLERYNELKELSKRVLTEWKMSEGKLTDRMNDRLSALHSKLKFHSKN